MAKYDRKFLQARFARFLHCVRGVEHKGLPYVVGSYYLDIGPANHYSIHRIENEGGGVFVVTPHGGLKPDEFVVWGEGFEAAARMVCSGIKLRG